MNKYEEIIYSLIYNCLRGISKEEEQILNQASAIYNTYNKLTEQLGCPLDVRCKVVCDSYIYDDDGNEYKVDYVYKNNFVCHNGQCDDFGCDYEFTFNWNDYKKIWFLKKGKSE